MFATGTCTLGIECNTLIDPNAAFRQIATRTNLNARRGPLTFVFLSIFKNLARKLHVKTIHDDVTEFIMNVIGDTIDYRQKNNVQRNDFLDVMIQLKNVKDKEKALTFNEIAAQVFSFFAAGFESQSLGLTFCLYELSKNLEIQTKARDVIEAALEKHNGQVTYEMAMDLPYIDQIIEGISPLFAKSFSILIETSTFSTQKHSASIRHRSHCERQKMIMPFLARIL